MPVYEYKCAKCREDFEVEQRVNDPKLADCPTCGERTTKRLIAGRTSFALKGSGWGRDLYSKG